MLVLVVHRHDRHLHPCLLGVQENRERWTALKAFAKKEGHSDAPKAVAEVRHRLTHPKVLDDLYDREHLLTEAWWLTVRYLELLILHWVGYTGASSIELSGDGHR